MEIETGRPRRRYVQMPTMTVRRLMAAMQTGRDYDQRMESIERGTRPLVWRRRTGGDPGFSPDSRVPVGGI